MSKPLTVLIVQSELPPMQTLVEFFQKRGDQVWWTSSVAEADALLGQHQPALAVVDLHLSGGDWVDLLRRIRQQFPNTQILVTNKHPDFRRELLAKEQDVHVFLREPFTREWIEKALNRLKQTAAGAAKDAAFQAALPYVRVPVGVKITLPYALLALVFAIAAAYLISRYVLESIQDRFTGQLADSGRLAADWMVQEENRLLETLRLVAHTQGLAEAVASGEAERLRELALPLAVNQQEEAIEILDPGGRSLLSLRHVVGGTLEEYDATRGEAIFAGWDFVRRVLNGQTDAQGDKFMGVAPAPWGDYFYVAGPVVDSSGRLIGAVLVGKSLPALARQIRQDTLAHVTLYDLQGAALVSTLFVAQNSQPLTPERAAAILAKQDEASPIRDLASASTKYSEIIGPWEARGGEDLGLLGTALAQTAIVRPTLVTRVQAFVIVALAFLFVVGLGVYLANQITRPLLHMMQASAEVARGNLEVKVETTGNDEVAVLAHSFNYMVSGLQEGFIYRDLLGRTVSPEVREEMRAVFASGDLRLDGQAVVATVLMSDIRGFTTLSEKAEPATILNWLNEYFGELVPVITAHGGVVDKFEGDAILAFFGILPRPLPPQASARQACRAAVDILAVVERLNSRRAARGEPLFVTGIGVNTGPVTAGGLGTADRMNYTIIGDAVNTTQRLESYTREFGENGAIVGEYTLAALQDQAHEFRFESLGAHTFKGTSEALTAYRLRGAPLAAGAEAGSG